MSPPKAPKLAKKAFSTPHDLALFVRGGLSLSEVEDAHQPNFHFLRWEISDSESNQRQPKQRPRQWESNIRSTLHAHVTNTSTTAKTAHRNSARQPPGLYLKQRGKTKNQNRGPYVVKSIKYKEYPDTVSSEWSIQPLACGWLSGFPASPADSRSPRSSNLPICPCAIEPSPAARYVQH